MFKVFLVPGFLVPEAFSNPFLGPRSSVFPASRQAGVLRPSWPFVCLVPWWRSPTFLVPGFLVPGFSWLGEGERSGSLPAAGMVQGSRRPRILGEPVQGSRGVSHGSWIPGSWGVQQSFPRSSVLRLPCQPAGWGPPSFVALCMPGALLAITYVPGSWFPRSR